jgi:hypothetical protein
MAATPKLGARNGSPWWAHDKHNLSPSRGNATLIGSSAGVVAAGICAANGARLTFLRFLRVGLPIAVAQIAVSALYAAAFYLMSAPKR